MIDFNQMDVETGLKLLSGLTAIIAFVQRVWDSLSIVKKKQAIKIDLEILELSKKNELINSSLLQNSLNDRISKMYIDTSTRIDNFRYFLIGVVIFVGFSWWSIDLYTEISYFNPWIILTGFMAVIGLTLMFERGDKKKTDNEIVPFFVFEILRKTDFILSLSLSVIFGLISWLIIIKSNGFSFWIILTGAFALLGISMLIAEMKIRIKK